MSGWRGLSVVCRGRAPAFWTGHRLSDKEELDSASGLGGRAATLAIRCLRGIATDRFSRQEEIWRTDIELS